MKPLTHSELVPKLTAAKHKDPEAIIKKMVASGRMFVVVNQYTKERVYGKRDPELEGPDNKPSDETRRKWNEAPAMPRDASLGKMIRDAGFDYRERVSF